MLAAGWAADSAVQRERETDRLRERERELIFLGEEKTRGKVL